MKTISPGHALSVCAAATILAGCGGSSMPVSHQLPDTSQIARAQGASWRSAAPDASCQGRQSFNFTGHAQNFKVPTCVTSVYVDAMGAAGEGATASGGDGGEVSATVPVTPGEKLVVMVGGAGSVTRGGFNGGATGGKNGRGKELGGGGGGASDVREGGNALTNRIIVAGGGGGTVIARDYYRRLCRHCNARVMASAGGGTGGGLPDGGGGGTPTCDFGTPTGGGGGTQSSGGAGGSGTNGGSLGDGGVGASRCAYIMLPQVVQEYTVYYSSGGGGGYYGGGGGNDGGDGGGGSGYAEPTATNVSSQSGVNGGDGSTTICWGASNGCGTRQRIRR